MTSKPGIYALYTDEPVPMDDPLFMARSHARNWGRIAALSGESLEAACTAILADTRLLFGDVPGALVEATVTTVWLEVAAQRSGGS